MTSTAATDLQARTATAGIVVGIDGSDGSAHALAWAAARTETFGPVRPVAAWRYPAWAMSDPMLGAPPAMAPDDFAAAASQRADELVATLGDIPHEAAVVTRAAAGPALVDVGKDAELIVVGTRGRGAVIDGLLGSVSSHVVAHATVPVAVVPAKAPIEDTQRRVVVGIDGSENSVHAMAWAIRTAAEDVTIEAVMGWSQQVIAVPEPYVIPYDESEQQARANVERVLTEARALAGRPEREVVTLLEYGDPRTILRDRAAAADLLVLGARGHRGVAHLLLGSVTTGLVHQPNVTTVVVPIGPRS
ncbi:MAG: universal stress protein [Acidimicrobiales bacterium]